MLASEAHVWTVLRSLTSCIRLANSGWTTCKSAARACRGGRLSGEVSVPSVKKTPRAGPRLAENSSARLSCVTSCSPQTCRVCPPAPYRWPRTGPVTSPRRDSTTLLVLEGYLSAWATSAVLQILQNRGMGNFMRTRFCSLLPAQQRTTSTQHSTHYTGEQLTQATSAALLSPALSFATSSGYGPCRPRRRVGRLGSSRRRRPRRRGRAAPP